MYNNSQTQFVTKIKNSNCDKTQKLDFDQNQFLIFFCKNNLTPQQLMRWKRGSVLGSCDVLFKAFILGSSYLQLSLVMYT